MSATGKPARRSYKETAEERREREARMVDRAIEFGREQAFAEVRKALGILDEGAIRDIAREEAQRVLESHEEDHHT